MVKIFPLFVLFIFLLSACEDKVKKFDGFTQKEMEFLLSGDESKVWERLAVKEDGTEVTLDECGIENYLIFVKGNVGASKPLLYAYNQYICDSLDFCNQHPDFCASNEKLCAENADLCATLADGILYVGSWYAKAPFIKNENSDTLIFTINDKVESIYVMDINAAYATFNYKNRVGANSGDIIEYYQYSAPVEQ